MEKKEKKPVKKTAVKRTRKPKTAEKSPSSKAELTTGRAEKSIAEEKEIKSGRYIEAIGRRKTSVARVRLFTQGEKKIIVNEKPLNKYFAQEDLQKTVVSALEKMKAMDHFGITVVVRGGGINGQAEAIRHGISRALVKFNNDFRKRLRRAGYLTRDPRMRERKKFGLKRARKAPQWAKR